MSVYDKRVTRDMRTMLLKMHNDLKDIKNTVEESKDIWLSDLRKMEEMIEYLQEEFDFAPRSINGSHWADWYFAEDMREENHE